VTIAFVLISVDTGEGSEVEKELSKINGVNSVYPVYGVYDYIARIETSDIPKLNELITKKIRQIDHLSSTITLITID
jgi:DNA-binding Lrp family transcriptional regulator